MKTAMLPSCCRLSSYLVYTVLIFSIWCAVVTQANRPPELTSHQLLIITGKNSTAPPIFFAPFALQASDPDGDPFKFSLKSYKPTTEISTISVLKDGMLTIAGVCDTCIGEVKFVVDVTDALGASQSFIMTVQIKDRSNGDLKLKSTSLPSYSASKGLHRWHIYLIILAVILTVTVVASIVMHSCCTFEAGLYEMPLKRPNKIIDKGDGKERRLSMNPFAKPKKTSLIVREALRSGAVDGAPYYGTRKSGVWIPNAPEDDNKKSQPVPLRLMSISEEGRRQSYAPPPPPPPKKESTTSGNDRRKDSVDLLGRLSWHDISAPRR